MGRYSWAPDAVNDLNDIYDYVVEHDVVAADRLIDEIDRKAELYAGNPLLGEERPELASGLRAFRVSNYVVLYRVARNGIVIARVVHAARNLPRLFEEGS
jgi:toxin ParE1/3/4